MKKIATSLILILVIFSNLCSQEIPYGQEFQVNTYAQNDQANPTVATLSDGKFVICWESQEQDGSGLGIFCQLFDAFGRKIGDEFQVNTYIIGDQRLPKVAGLLNDNFVVCWESWAQVSSEWDVIGQLFDASGNKINKEFQVNTYTQGHSQNSLVIAMTGLSNSEFVVCWESFDLYYGIFGQLFDSSCTKIGNEFSMPGKAWGKPTTTYLSNGEFIVCWTNWLEDGSDTGISGQLFDASGLGKGNEFLINTYTQGSQMKPSVANLLYEGCVVCWNSANQIQSGFDILGQLFDSLITKKGGEFLVNTTTFGHQSDPVISSLSDGGFVICWSSDQNKTSAGFYSTDIYGQIFDSLGGKKGNEFQINTSTDYFESLPSISLLQNGSFIVCWESWDQDGSKLGIFAKMLILPIIHQLTNYSLIAPLNDITLNNTRPTFRWQQPSTIRECYPWELTFDLYIDTDSNFPNPQIIKNIQDTTYTIDSLEPGKTYFWKVLAKNLAGDSLWSTQQDWGFFIKPGATLIEKTDIELPQNFELFQNYPNPFNSETSIHFALPEDGYTTVKIYDIKGRLVKTLLNEYKTADTYTIKWNGRTESNEVTPSGLYIFQIISGKYKSMKKMVMVK